MRPTSDRVRESLFDILAHGRLSDGPAFEERARARRLCRHRRLRPRGAVARRGAGELPREGPRRARGACAPISRRSARRSAPRSCRGDALRAAAGAVARDPRLSRSALSSRISPHRRSPRSPRAAGSPPARWWWSRSRRGRSSSRARRVHAAGGAPLRRGAAGVPALRCGCREIADHHPSTPRRRSATAAMAAAAVRHAPATKVAGGP